MTHLAVYVYRPAHQRDELAADGEAETIAGRNPVGEPPDFSGDTVVKDLGHDRMTRVRVTEERGPGRLRFGHQGRVRGICLVDRGLR